MRFRLNDAFKKQISPSSIKCSFVCFLHCACYQMTPQDWPQPTGHALMSRERINTIKKHTCSPVSTQRLMLQALVWVCANDATAAKRRRVGMTQAPVLACCHSDGMTHLEVPVHNVMLVDVGDAFQDLIDAMTEKNRQGERESRGEEKRVGLGRETQALVQGSNSRRSGRKKSSCRIWPVQKDWALHKQINTLVCFVVVKDAREAFQDGNENTFTMSS